MLNAEVTALLNPQIRPSRDLIDPVFTLVRSQVVATYNRTATPDSDHLCYLATIATDSCWQT